MSKFTSTTSKSIALATGESEEGEGAADSSARPQGWGRQGRRRLGNIGEGRGRHHGRTGGAPPRGSPRRERRRGLGCAAAGLGCAGAPPLGRWRRGGSAAAGEMEERRCAVAGEGRVWRRDRSAADGGGEGVVLPLLVAGEEEGAA